MKAALSVRRGLAVAASLVVLAITACTGTAATSTPRDVPTATAIQPGPTVSPMVEPTTQTPAVATNTPLPIPTLTPIPTLPAPTPSPTQAPTSTPSPTASPTTAPTATPTPGPGATGPAISAFPQLQRFPVPTAPEPIAPEVPQGPFPTPTARPAARSNLTPINSGFRVSGAEPSGEYRAENTTISWRVSNTGPATTNDEFNIEIRFDDVTLAQWTAQGLSTSTFLFVDSIEGLLDGLPISPGSHEISLVIDPLDSIVEVSESDNTQTRVITMVGSQPNVVSPELLPNLVPSPWPGKRESIFVSSHPSDPLSGKLSVDIPAYLAIGATNPSIQYIDQKIEVDLYFDDKLARRLVWSDLGADESLQFTSDDLRDLIEIAPGPHTLRVVTDPLNRIQESDETDNEYTIDLVWGVGEPSPAAEPFVLEPPPRQPTTRANLMPFRPFGWSSGITASTDNRLVPEGTDGWLEVAKAVRIDFAFTNASRFSLPLTDQLKADVLIDGQFIERRSFSSGTGNVGVVWRDDVSMPRDTVTAGEHTVRVVLDPEGLFDELDETDNIFERTFIWHDGPDAGTEEVFELSDQEIADAFAPLFGGMRRETRPVLGLGAGERDWTREIIAAGRAAYFMLTGRDVNEEGYVLNFLPPDEFAAGSTATCMSRWLTMTVTEYENAFDVCTDDRGEIGFKTRSNGQIHLFVDLGLSPLDALGTYLHELGHGLQDLRNPAQTVLPFSTNTRGLFEAQAQMFEAAGWRAIEESVGERLSLFPDVKPARDRFDFLFDLRRNRSTEHDVGYRLLWTLALSDVDDPSVADVLRSGDVLDSTEAMSLYDFLVDLRAQDVTSVTAELLARTDLLDEFEQIATQRFVTDLPVESTGHNALQDAIWTAP